MEKEVEIQDIEKTEPKLEQTFEKKEGRDNVEQEEANEQIEDTTESSSF